jgi:hypothetical protein
MTPGARRGRARWAVVGLAAGALLACGCSYSIVRGGTIDERAAAKIERNLEKVRGLRFLSPVPMEAKSAEELQSYLRAELEREYSAEEIRALAIIYERLGLLPAGTDLGAALLKLYSAQIAGFYDPHEAKLFLVPSGVPSAGWTMNVLQFLLRRDLVNEMLLSHELTHALQDQHFGTLAAADDRSNDDRSLAIHAVLEGDATLAGFAYVLGGLPESSLLDLVARLSAVPAELEAALPDTPAILRDSLVFQYSSGAYFVALAYLRGGWPAVDALLAHPPTSTEQVLWPEKYFVRPDTPKDVRIGGLDDYRTSAEWTVAEENTLGALSIRILGEGFFDAARAEKIAQGWDGDRLVAFARGDALHLYWISVWDREEEAEEFFAAEREILERLYSGAAREIEARRVVAGGERPYWLERRGDEVLLAIGAPRAEVAKRCEAIWAKTVVAPQQIHMDLDLATATGGAKARF